MSSDSFHVSRRGETPEDTFIACVEEAYWDFGHSGYTGTICEKPGFIKIPTIPDVSVESIIDAFELAKDHEDHDEHWTTLKNAFGSKAAEYLHAYHDKWQEALCYEEPTGMFNFFGHASS